MSELRVDTIKDAAGTGGSSIYLGGVASANLLDDYEEGTFTPVYSPASGAFDSVTYDGVTAGTYTKIGDTVNINIRIRTDAATVGTASGNLSITGLPYSAATITGGGLHSTLFLSNNPISYDIVGNIMRLYYKTTIGGNTSFLQVSDFGTGANANTIQVNFSFKV